jgi:hypothetical protein
MSKKSTKIIAGILIFFLFSFVPFIYFNSIFRKQWDNSDYVMNRRNEFDNLPDNAVNTLILGSSGVFAGINPAILYEEGNIYSYNLSSTYNFLPMRYHELKDIIEEKSIKLIVTDCSNLEFTEDAIFDKDRAVNYKTGFNFIKKHSNKREYVRDIKLRFPEVKTTDYLFPFFVHHTNWHKISSDRIEGNSLKYIMGMNLLKEAKMIEPVIDEKHHNNSSINKEYLLKIAELCKDKDVHLLLIDAPKYLYKSNLESEIKDILGEGNYKFINYTNPSLLNKMEIHYETNFYDDNHLNLFGAEKFSKYLAKDIAELFPDIPIENMPKEKEAIWRDALLEFEKYKESLK